MQCTECGRDFVPDERDEYPEETDVCPECERCPDEGDITCWCGARGTYEELFDDAALDEPCGGSGTLHCFCGGDLCVCHNHGEVECPGCEDCREHDTDLDGWNHYEDDA